MQNESNLLTYILEISYLRLIWCPLVVKKYATVLQWMLQAANAADGAAGWIPVNRPGFIHACGLNILFECCLRAWLHLHQDMSARMWSVWVCFKLCPYSNTISVSEHDQLTLWCMTSPLQIWRNILTLSRDWSKAFPLSEIQKGMSLVILQGGISGYWWLEMCPVSSVCGSLWFVLVSLDSEHCSAGSRSP